MAQWLVAERPSRASRSRTRPEQFPCLLKHKTAPETGTSLAPDHAPSATESASGVHMTKTSTDGRSSHDRPTQRGAHPASRHRQAVPRHVLHSPGTAAPSGWRAVGATMMIAAALTACDARESPTPKTGPSVSAGTTNGATAGPSTGAGSGAATTAPSSNSGAGMGSGNNTGTAGGSAPAHAPPGPPSNPPDITSGTRSPQRPDQTGGPDSRAPAGSGSISGGAGTSGMSGSGAAAGSGGSADERR